jgi:hypothetical protein
MTDGFLFLGQVIVAGIGPFLRAFVQQFFVKAHPLPADIFLK